MHERESTATMPQILLYVTMNYFVISLHGYPKSFLISNQLLRLVSLLAVYLMKSQRLSASLQSVST